jgi:hypothetical protein
MRYGNRCRTPAHDQVGLLPYFEVSIYADPFHIKGFNGIKMILFPVDYNRNSDPGF